MEDEIVEELEPSVLGTKEHWDQCYQRELDNFSQNGDVGEVWFGDEAGLRMVNWLVDHPEYVDQSESILDSGTGNGMLCIDLVRDGFTNVTGVDYCKDAIMLARKVSEEAGVQVQFEVGNILTRDTSSLSRTYKVVTDKGTFDAISLSMNAKNDKQAYIKNTADILTEDGLLVITSCNWTEEELVLQFSDFFELLDSVPTPSFSFGGKTGRSITTVIFRKKPS